MFAVFCNGVTQASQMKINRKHLLPWWRHQMETLFALLAVCEGNAPTTGGFSSQRPVTQSLDFFLDLRMNKRLSKQSRRRWFETPLRSLWRRCNGDVKFVRDVTSEFFQSKANKTWSISLELHNNCCQLSRNHNQYIRSVAPEAGIKAGTNDYIPQILWDVITCPQPW